MYSTPVYKLFRVLQWLCRVKPFIFWFRQRKHNHCGPPYALILLAICLFQGIKHSFASNKLKTINTTTSGPFTANQVKCSSALIGEIYLDFQFYSWLISGLFWINLTIKCNQRAAVFDVWLCLVCLHVCRFLGLKSQHKAWQVSG